MDVLQSNNKNFYFLISITRNIFKINYVKYNIYKIKNLQNKKYSLFLENAKSIIINTENYFKIRENIRFMVTSKVLFEKNISKGLNCCLIILENNIIHENWFALNKIANQNFETWCVDINWNNEATWGNAKTIDKFKGKGLYSHSLSIIFDQFIKLAKEFSYFSVKKNNYYANYSVKKFNPLLIGSGYKLNFSFFSFKIISKI